MNRDRLDSVLSADTEPQSLRDMLEARADLIDANRSLLDSAVAERRDLTSDEQQQFDRRFEDIDRLSERIQEKQESRGAGRLDAPQNGRRESRGTVLFEDANGNEVRSVSHTGKLTSNNGPELRVGKILHSLVTGRPDELSREERDSLGSASNGGGYMLNPTLSQTVIDLARSASVCSRAGAVSVPMTGSELKIARVVSDPTAYWRSEGAAVTASSPVFGSYSMTPKTCAVLIPVNMELLEDSPNAANALEMVVRNVLGAAIDKACLIGGSGPKEPTGLVNDTGVNEVSTVGTPTDFSEIADGIEEIFNDNYPGETSDLSLIYSPPVARVYDGLLDGNGVPLLPSPWVQAVKFLRMTSIGDTQMVLGDFRHLLMGWRTSGVSIEVLREGTGVDADSVTHNAVTEFKVWIRARVRFDCLATQPGFFCKLTGVTTA